jgi:hypothetical protein
VIEGVEIMKTLPDRFVVLVLAALGASFFAMYLPSSAVMASAGGGVVATGDTAVPRFDHTATLLSNGKVLIAGGMARNGVPEPTAEVYDPATRRFTPVGKMASPRGWGATATLLPNGKVLLTGGATGSWCSPLCYLATTELYDPATGTFSPTGNMTKPRAGAFAVLLHTGNVLIIGGEADSDDGSRVTAELYDSLRGVFSPAGSMSKAMGVSATVVLKSGKVLVVGDTAEIYDPSTGRFTSSGRMITPRGKVGATLLPDGKVLIVGGQVDGAWGPRIATTEIYDPQTGTFTSGPTMNFSRYKLRNGVVLLSNGRIFVAGGADTPEVYDPATSSFRPTAGSKLDGFCFSTATLLNNGDVLMVGGYGYHPGDGAVNHAWLYHP